MDMCKEWKRVGLHKNGCREKQKKKEIENGQIRQGSKRQKRKVKK